MYQSSQSVTEDSQSWGSRRTIYTDYTAPTITNRHEKKLTNLFSSGGVLVSVVVAGGSSMRFSSNFACLPSKFALLCTRPPPRSVSAVLFGQRCRDCFWYVVTDPITVVCKEIYPLRTTVHRSCYRQQQAAVVSVICTASREDSSCCSTNLQQLVGGS